jgi:hypothetical protein
MNAHCGGCRARAYGMTGDLMAEDPLCTHTPGKFPPSLLRSFGVAGSGSEAGLAPLQGADEAGSPRSRTARSIQYGGDSPATIEWDDTATARMKKIPAFVRGMVVRAVEESCRKNGISRVTAEELERIRARMPTPKIFSR